MLGRTAAAWTTVNIVCAAESLHGQGEHPDARGEVCWGGQPNLDYN